MTDLDRTSLERLLPATPGPADWDDVLSRSGAHQRRRRRLVAVAAIALVVAVVSGSAIGSVRDFVLRTGFIGLPPIGATPSSSGERRARDLVLGPLGCQREGQGRTRAWVYADGRLISWGGPDRPGSANPLSTGFLEQRLTPEGVERLRSEIAAAGDFGDPDELAPPGKPPCPLGQSPSDRKKAIANGDCQLPTPEPAPDAPITVPFYYTDSRGGPRHARSRRPCARSHPTVRATLGSGIVAPGERVGGERRQGVRGVEVRRLLRRDGRPTSRSNSPASWRYCRQRPETCSGTLR